MDDGRWGQSSAILTPSSIVCRQAIVHRLLVGGKGVARVLVTGGRGTLGREVVAGLARGGYTVRVMSHRSREPGAGGQAGSEWAQADLQTGEGLAGAVAGVDAIVHAASSP